MSRDKRVSRDTEQNLEQGGRLDENSGSGDIVHPQGFQNTDLALFELSRGAEHFRKFLTEWAEPFPTECADSNTVGCLTRRGENLPKEISESNDEKKQAVLEKQSPIEFKVSDYDEAIWKLEMRFEGAIQQQQGEAYLGWTKLGRDGRKGEPIKDEFIALSRVLESSSGDSAIDRDMRNVAAFLLLNEETRLESAKSRLLFKSAKRGNSEIADLEKAPLERVMTKIFRPEIVEIGGERIRLYKPVLATPIAEQIQTLRASMEARIEAG